MAEISVLDLSSREVRSLMRNPNNRENNAFIGTVYAAEKISNEYFVPIPKKFRTYRGKESTIKYSQSTLSNSKALRRYKENSANIRILPDPLYDPVKIDRIHAGSKLGKGIPLSMFINGPGARTTLNHLTKGERREIAKQFYCHVPLIEGFRNNKRFDRHSLTITEGLVQPFSGEVILPFSVRYLQTKGRAVVYEVLNADGKVDPYKTFELASYWKDNHVFQSMILHYDTLNPTREIIKHGSWEDRTNPPTQPFENEKPYHAEIVMIMPEVDPYYQGDFQKSVQTDFNFNLYVSDGLMHFSYK